jgi:hypothetical protein
MATAKIADDFDQLVTAHHGVYQKCYDVLAPEKTQPERDVVRTALKNYLDLGKENPKDTTE